MVTTQLKSKRLWILPLVLTTIIAWIIFNKLSFDIIELKNQKHIVIRLIIYTTIVSPIFFLQFSAQWKALLLHKKFLIASISFLLFAVNFRLQAAYQFSILLTISGLYYFYKEKKIFKPNTFAILTVFYFLWSAISLIWTSDTNEGFRYLLILSPLLFISIAFSFFSFSKTDFDLIAVLIVRFVTFYVFLSLCSWVLQSNFLEFPLQNALGFEKYYVGEFTSYNIVFAWTDHMHPTYIALILMFSLGICWYYFSKKETSLQISIYDFIFILIGTFILSSITASRFMQLMWLLVNVAGGLHLLHRNRKLYAIGASVVLIVSIVSIFVFSKKIVHFFDDPVRECHYNAAEKGISENLLLGTGLGGMTDYINFENEAYEPLHVKSAADFVHIHPHNQIIGDLMQSGVIGLTLILLIIITISVYSYKYRNWLLLVYTIMFLILMNIEMPLMYGNGIFIFAVFFNFLSVWVVKRKYYQF